MLTNLLFDRTVADDAVTALPLNRAKRRCDIQRHR